MQTDQLFELLFKRKVNSDGSAAFLKEVTEQYPYFTPAQFYLLKGTEEGTAAYNDQAATTALLFNNSYWLNFQLQEKQPAKKELKETVATKAEEPAAEIIPDIEPEVAARVQNEVETQEEAPIPPLKLHAFDSSKHNMLFEPMHMVDYFASQGIKLNEELQTGDKLGKQLKSFTEWLKTTKRVIPGNNYDTNQPGGHAENAVQHQAEKSNIEGEVVTESMAEVFAMQGKAKKAIEVYEKLSLLNPAKSAFFAAKINNLKG